MTTRIDPKRIIRIDYHPSYDYMIWEMVQDELADLMIRKPYRIEDHGVGGYEYWGCRGVDYRPVPMIELNEDVIEVWVPKKIVEGLGGEKEVSDLFTDGTDQLTHTSETDLFEVRVVAEFDKTRWDTKLFIDGDKSEYYVANYRLWQE